MISRCAEADFSKSFAYPPFLRGGSFFGKTTLRFPEKIPNGTESNPPGAALKLPLKIIPPSRICQGNSSEDLNPGTIPMQESRELPQQELQTKKRPRGHAPRGLCYPAHGKYTQEFYPSMLTAFSSPLSADGFWTPAARRQGRRQNHRADLRRQPSAGLP